MVTSFTIKIIGMHKTKKFRELQGKLSAKRRPNTESDLLRDEKVRVMSLRGLIYYKILNQKSLLLHDLVIQILSDGVDLNNLELVTAALNGLQQDGFLNVTYQTNNEGLSVDVLITAVLPRTEV